MKTKITILAILLAVATCKGKGEENAPQAADKNQTHLVKIDGLQVAFDLMTMEYHKKMMKLMNADMSYTQGATHGLMVTVLDNETKKVLEDSQVSLTITDPDNKVSHPEPEIMHGAGMHHYAIHMKAVNGKYHILAEIKRNNKTYKAETDFDVEN